MIDVVLPQEGPLFDLDGYAMCCLFDCRGTLRKIELKARPLTTVASLIASWNAHIAGCVDPTILLR